MGTVFRSKNGKWWIVRERVDGRQKDFRPNVHGFPNSEKGAKSFLASLKVRLDTGQAVVQTKDTFASYAEKWLAGKKLSPATWESYQSILRNHLLPGLGKYPLAKITPLMLRDFYAGVKNHHDEEAEPSHALMQKIHMILKSILNDAVEMEVLARSPMKKALTPKTGEPKSKPKFYTADQVKVILDTAKDTRAYVPVALAIMTGMRAGEVCGLRWEDVDLEKKRIIVRRSISATPGKLTEKCTKTGKERTISISPELIRILIWHRGKQSERKLQKGSAWNPNGYVWCNWDGTPERPGDLSSAWRWVAPKTGLPFYSFHSFRHTHVSLLIGQGESMKAIQERAGHTNISTTMDIYGHMEEGSDAEMVARLDKALGFGG